MLTGGDTVRRTAARAALGRAAAAVRTCLEAAPLSGAVLVLMAVGWLLRLVPALDIELEDMEEHQRASTMMLPDWGWVDPSSADP
jgi:hypothetical protein